MDNYKQHKINKCPICLDVMDYITTRYPKAICKKCATTDIKDSDGNLVSFSNIDLLGGFVSLHNVNNKIVKKIEHICWVKNVKCYADEARFGGIIIQKID
jgi:hypothetical protein